MFLFIYVYCCVQASTATNDAAATHNSQLAITNASALAAMTNERNAAVTVSV
jgi:hypothetical protein